MQETIFIATIVTQILLGGSLVLTVVSPKFRVWPPPGRTSWQYVYTWTLTIVSFAGILALGVFDWNSFELNAWFRFSLGVPIITLSFVLAVWSIRILGVYASQGLGGKLVQQGPYRFTRNPQYVADIFLLAGFAVLTGSSLVLVTCTLGAVWFVLSPFAEEPWLREGFGPESEYDAYLKQVPRFLSLAIR